MIEYLLFDCYVDNNYKLQIRKYIYIYIKLSEGTAKWPKQTGGEGLHMEEQKSKGRTANLYYL